MRIMIRDYANRVSGPYDVRQAIEHAMAPSGDGQFENLRDCVDALADIVARLLEHSGLDKRGLEAVLGPEFEVTED